MAGGLIQGLSTVLRLVGRLLGFLRKVPIIDELGNRIQRKLLNPIVVKLVRDYSDPDLDAALKLYADRIPEDQQFESSDIVRWIREDEQRRKLNISSDWFLAAKYRKRICGFVLFHYVPSARLVLFAYMAVAKTPGIAVDAISNSLTAYIARLFNKSRELRGSRGFLLEVEDPRKETGKKRDESLARVRRFCTLAEMQGFSLRALKIDYKQPKLTLADTQERPMLLLSARTRHGSADSVNHRAEVEEALCFIYTKVYPEGFSPEPSELAAYKDYCAELLKTEIAKLPLEVGSLSCAELAAQIGKKKPKKASTAHSGEVA
jgi:hypothetical protein